MPAAFAGLDNNAVFIAADVDLSGTLSAGEFATTLEAGLSANAVQRKFRAADRNLNGSVQLNEFLIFTGTIPAPSKAEEQFAQLDGNGNASLTYEEFTATAKVRASVVSIRRQFFRADANSDSTVTLAEWTTYKSNKSPRVFYSIFELSDLDGDDQLTPDEFGYFYARGTASSKIMARFSTKDDNDDGVLTRAEWNPGVRGGGSL